MSDKKFVSVRLTNGQVFDYLKYDDGVSIGAFGSYAMPLVRRIFPELLAKQVVGVQPMTAPVGLAYAMRYAEPDRKKTGFTVKNVSKSTRRK